MTKLHIKSVAIALSLSVGLGFAGAAQTMPPFGSDDDQAYAAKIWAAMQDQRLAGDNAIYSFPYEGTDPHGMMLETFYSKATIDGNKGDLVVKRNYGPEGVSADEVLANPEKHLGAITVMYRREAGFDSDNKDWFWVKFLPDGTLDKNPKGMALAGKVAKGADKGCIACHTGADGGDYVFTSNAFK
jgi:cytochrome P460